MVSISKTRSCPRCRWHRNRLQAAGLRCCASGCACKAKSDDSPGNRSAGGGVWGHRHEPLVRGPRMLQRPACDRTERGQPVRGGLADLLVTDDCGDGQIRRVHPAGGQPRRGGHFRAAGPDRRLAMPSCHHECSRLFFWARFSVRRCCTAMASSPRRFQFCPPSRAWRWRPKLPSRLIVPSDLRSTDRALSPAKAWDRWHRQSLWHDYDHLVRNHRFDRAACSRSVPAYSVRARPPVCVAVFRQPTTCMGSSFWDRWCCASPAARRSMPTSGTSVAARFRCRGWAWPIPLSC